MPAPRTVWRVAIGVMALMSVHGAQAADCFQVRGRLAIWNGAPAVRIWPVGTRRMLGVHTQAGEREGEGLMPAAVAKLIEATPDQTVVYGNYLVCPLTPDRPGHMRIVYIAAATRLRADRR